MPDQVDSDDFGFDRIVFNFPHLGLGVSDKKQSIKQHQEFLKQFFHSAINLLAPNGQLHVTSKNKTKDFCQG